MSSHTTGYRASWTRENLLKNYCGSKTFLPLKSSVLLFSVQARFEARWHIRLYSIPRKSVESFWFCILPGLAQACRCSMDKMTSIALDGIPGMLLSPDLKFSDEPGDSPLRLITSSTLWDWMETPAEKYRLRRFGIAMQGVQVVQPPSSTLNGITGAVFNVWM